MSTTKKVVVKKPEAKDVAVSAEVVADRLDRVVANTDKAITDLRDQMESNQLAIMDAINAMSSGKAVDRHVSINKDRIEADEQELGLVRKNSEEDEELMLDLTGYSDVDSAGFKQKMELDQFMNESVQVHIHESFSDERVPLFDVSVNGRSVVFRFGETKIVPRFIVEGLARAKPMHFGNEMYKKKDGSDSVRNPMTRGLRYPFSVERDPNPKGAQWLRDILAQA